MTDFPGSDWVGSSLNRIRQNVQIMPKTSADRLKQRIGQEWIRTTEGVKPADLQSAPFGHFGTYPERSFAVPVAVDRRKNAPTAP